MSSLETFGIYPGDDEQHAVMADPRKFNVVDFFEQAEILLDSVTPVVLDDIVANLENYPGMWNPGCFMVFPLGLHDSLGSLRLHVWPIGFARENSQGPNIHNHGWHLASRILVGNYFDTIYQIETATVNSDSDIAVNGLLRLFETRRSIGGHDALLKDGMLVKPKPVLDRIIPAGETHTIEAGIYHVTNIPVDELAATLVVDSPAFAISTHVLLDDARQDIERKRKPVEIQEIEAAKQQLLGSLTN